MTKSERTELRRKFFVCFANFVFHNKQYDDVNYSLPQINWNDKSDSFVCITITKGPMWANITWDLQEISFIGRNLNCLIQCRLDDALWSIQEIKDDE